MGRLSTGHRPIERVVRGGAHMTDKAVEGAEGREIDPRFDQRLDRAVDEIGRVAHARGEAPLTSSRSAARITGAGA